MWMFQRIAAKLRDERRQVESRVRLGVAVELEAMLRHLGLVLPPNEYDKVLEVLARSEPESREGEQ